MPDEREGAAQAETGWIAFFLTFGGAALGPLAVIVFALYVAGRSDDAKELILASPWPILLGVIAGSFVLGAFVGNWLGNVIGRAIYLLRKTSAQEKPPEPNA